MEAHRTCFHVLLLLTLRSASAVLPLSMLRPMRTPAVRTYWRRDDTDLSRAISAILKHSPSLKEPIYKPTPWARSAKANFALALLRSRLGELRRRVEPPLVGRVTTCKDPDVTVEWAKDEDALALAPDAPIVIFLHTITGSAAQTRWQMGQASRRGWRACTFVRRGHGSAKLGSPSFNLLGDTDDVEMQVEAVRRMYPDAFLGMVGVSAGSGLLISYLGRAGASTPVAAACAICPAWDVSVAFDRLSEDQPAVSKLMLANIKSTFIKRNERLLREWDTVATDACLAATSLPELLAAHAPFAMRERGASASDYFAVHNPMEHRTGVSVPTLVLNAEDDFVCSAHNIRPDLIVRDQPGSLLLVTRSGSHCAYNEGAFGRGSFHTRVSFDFLDGARAAAREAAAAKAAAARMELSDSVAEDDTLEGVSIKVYGIRLNGRVVSVRPPTVRKPVVAEQEAVLSSR